MERIGEEVDSHSKEIDAQSKQIAAEALRKAQPEIEKAQLLAKNLTEKFANLDKLKLLEDGDIDGYVAAITENANEVVRQMSLKTAAPRPAVRPELPASPVRFKINRQISPERKSLINKEQLENQQNDARKTMDSLQSAMIELNNTKTQETINKIQAKLDAVKNKENWDVAFNENTEDIKKATNNFTIAYTNKMGKMIKKWVNSITADVDLKDLNEIQIQLKSELDKLQFEKINIQMGDKHIEKSHKRNSDVNVNIMADDNRQGS